MIILGMEEKNEIYIDNKERILELQTVKWTFGRRKLQKGLAKSKVKVTLNDKLIIFLLLQPVNKF